MLQMVRIRTELSANLEGLLMVLACGCNGHEENGEECRLMCGHSDGDGGGCAISSFGLLVDETLHIWKKHFQW